MTPRTIGEIDTPAIVVDVGIMQRNLARVAAYASEHRLRLRPHTKTHKIPELGRMQLESGAVGLTVAKTTEAEVMLGAEPDDLLIAYPVIGREKVRRAAELAGRTALTVAVDSADAAAGLSEAAVAAGSTIGILIEIDVGLRRVGVPPGAGVLALAQQVSAMRNLELRGLAYYPGHIKTMDDAAEAELRRVNEVLRQTLDLCRAAGLDLAVVSGGSTPALFHSHVVNQANEIRPGTYIFNDRNTWMLGGCALEDCAATVLTTVVSTSVPNRVIIDGGSKTFSSDRCAADGAEGFGYFGDAPEVLFEKMNEEHGFLRVEGRAPWRVGDRVRVLPNHICTAVNLHEKIYGVDGERVVEVWEVRGRGKLQ